MRRRTFDALMTIAGLILTFLLIVAGGLLAWSSSFIDDEVTSQLKAQQIFFPEKGSQSLEDPAVKPHLEQYAGQQLTTGEQAKAWADHYIAVHLDAMTGGRTYAEVSADALANPNDEEAGALVDTVFRGTTLRGLLLNAYAFGQMGTVALYGAIAAFIGAGLMFVFSLLGLWHLRRVSPEQDLTIGHAAHALSA